MWQRVDEGRRSAELPVRVERRSDTAPDVAVETHRGERLALRSSSGEFQLVHFWATWCVPCRKELPLVLDLAERERGRLRVWAVSTDPNWTSIERFLDARLPPEVVRDPNGEASGAYRVTGLPDSYLIDPAGRIRARFFGAQNWSAPEMERILQDLLNSP